jgi:diguanylate cyclase (GGDEF)-like protein
MHCHFDERQFEAVYDAFYNEFLTQKNMSSFFESKEQIKEIAEKQKKLLIDYLKENIFDPTYYEKIGRSHYSRRIPFVAIYEAVNYLERATISLFLHSETLINSIKSIISYYEEAERFIAKGYFFNDIHRFVQTLEKKRNKSYAPVVAHLMEIHVDWMRKLDRIVQKEPLDCNEFEAFIETPCLFGKELDLLKEHSHTGEEFEQIRQEHIEFHKNLYVLHYALKRGDYIRAYALFQEIKTLILEIETLLFVINIFDISEELKYDALTHAFSKRMIAPIIGQEIELSRLAGKPLIVAMVDIDNFKRINDTFGHKFGDFVLAELVRLMRQNMRRSDYLFRYGGEEFLILIPNTDLEGASHVLEKVRRKVYDHLFKKEDQETRLTISIGLFEVDPEQIQSIDRIIDEADKRLYKAKRSGKNKIISLLR